MERIVQEQILKVRDTGEVNMFDVNGVIAVANRNGWCDLVLYLWDKRNHGEYSRFILTGKTRTED